jgi:hypothetical protein
MWWQKVPYMVSPTKRPTLAKLTILPEWLLVNTPFYRVERSTLIRVFSGRVDYVMVCSKRFHLGAKHIQYDTGTCS